VRSQLRFHLRTAKLIRLDRLGSVIWVAVRVFVSVGVAKVSMMSHPLTGTARHDERLGYAEPPRRFRFASRHVAEQLGNGEAVLVLDPSAFAKKGTSSCGVVSSLFFKAPIKAGTAGLASGPIPPSASAA